MKLSIVTTLYKSAPWLMEFYTRISHSAQEITYDYEIIFVNDGSPDDSLQVAKNIQILDNKLSIIDLSRNFGHHRAIMTGLSYAKGDHVFLVDCDLEEDPELLDLFWKEISNNKDLDAVYGIQEKRKGGLIEKLTGNYFYKIINHLSEVKISENVMVVRLMTRHYVQNLLKHTERELVFVGIAALTGFKQKALSVAKKNKGSTTYNFGKKINLAVNFITSLTSKPLVFIFYLGLFVTFFSLMATVYLIFRKIFFGLTVPGWISIMVSIWFLGGVIIFCLGIIGIYLSKIFIEVKQRPYTLIKAIYCPNKNSMEIEW
jgi:putative glycosyltransferase